MSWFFFALLSAFFAAITTILAKIGIQGLDSNLATAVRTVIIFVFAWSIVLFQGTQKSLLTIPRFTLLFLILSGITTGLSWLFYFKALQLGNASQVSPIDKLSLALTIIFAFVFLKEKVSLLTASGALLMTLGAIMISLNH